MEVTTVSKFLSKIISAETKYSKLMKVLIRIIIKLLKIYQKLSSLPISVTACFNNFKFLMKLQEKFDKSANQFFVILCHGLWYVAYCFPKVYSVFYGNAIGLLIILIKT